MCTGGVVSPETHWGAAESGAVLRIALVKEVGVPGPASRGGRLGADAVPGGVVLGLLGTVGSGATCVDVQYVQPEGALADGAQLVGRVLKSKRSLV